jgi:hypothetical protein
MTSDVLPLADPRADLAAAGGKGASLELRVYAEAFDGLIKAMSGVEGLYGARHAVAVNAYGYTSMNLSGKALLMILFHLTPQVIRMLRDARGTWEARCRTGPSWLARTGSPRRSARARPRGA